MRALLSAGIFSLILAYMLSQFYRAFLAVLSPVLQGELGAAPDTLALSSGLWFLAFTAMQIPIGRALDRVGPRRTVACLLVFGGVGGATVFALATAPWHLHVAMALLGVGCSPALMGSYYIFARNYPPSALGALGGATIGIGSLGNILGSTPLVWVIEALGWRNALWAMAAATLLIALAVLMLVRDPERVGGDSPRGSLADVLRLRALWFILPLLLVSYAAPAALRGLWAGPYLSQVFGASDQTIGHATLIMGLAMVVSNFAVGWFARLAGSPRRAALILNAGAVAILMLLWGLPAFSLTLSIALLGLIAIAGAAYPLLMSHGRAFLPQHLVGQGVTFLNMFSIGGVGALQFASGPYFAQAAAAGDPAHAYSRLFLFFAFPLTVGVMLYLLTPEAPDA